MALFEKMIGNEAVKNYFKKTLQSSKLSHSYIFEGPHGVGKKTYAMELIQFLLCESLEGSKPCHQCKSCHMIEAMTHPDVIVIQEGAKVDTIRTKVVQEIEIRPYQGSYKIIMIHAADKLNSQAQNALLKTIEEPPEYSIILLLCENIESLLPTIRSRCVIVRFNPISEVQMQTYLEQNGITGEQQEIYKKLSNGSIGVAKEMLKNTTYLKLRQDSIAYLKRLEEAKVMELYAIVKEITDQKENIEQIVTFWFYWYRDIAVLKASQSQEIYYKDYDLQLLDRSSQLSYNKISCDLEHIKNALIDLNQNINATFIIENLLLQLKERKK